MPDPAKGTILKHHNFKKAKRVMEARIGFHKSQKYKGNNPKD